MEQNICNKQKKSWLFYLEGALLFGVLASFGLVLFWGARVDFSFDTATHMLSELEELERAGKRWAEAEQAEAGTLVSVEEVRAYVQPQTRRLAKEDKDVLGNDWPDFQVGEGFYPQVAAQSWEQLTPKLGEAFWQPFTKAEKEKSFTP